MEDHELDLLINELPQKWGTGRKAKQKQKIVNLEILKRIRVLEEANKPRKRGRPRKDETRNVGV